MVVAVAEPITFFDALMDTVELASAFAGYYCRFCRDCVDRRFTWCCFVCDGHGFDRAYIARFIGCCNG
ncbi:hypothetical protein RCO48_16655 [Peribacillus frigoritolerans]|nr:hypothetical protein [Peribacillus frigoritolerans]